MGKLRRGGLLGGAVTLLLALACAVAVAEVTQKGDVRVSVSGEMTPTKLPRSGEAPIAVSLGARILPTKKGVLPKLTRIRVAINAYAKVNLKGVPVCRLEDINPSTSEGAMEACGRALVGEGNFSADVRIAEQSPFPSNGKVLAFNGRLNGKPVVLAHVYGTKPLPTSYVLPFAIKESKGTYGTVLDASLPQVTGEWGYVTGIDLDLQRGYMSARCAAPAGFPSASFQLAQTRFSFADGPSLETTLNRTCKVR